MSDIYDPDRFMAGRWRWTGYGYERGFPRGCQFSDIDAIVEFDGRVLIIEGKGYDGNGPIPGLSTGQRLLLQKLASVGFATIVLYGDAQKNEPYAVRDIATGELHDWRGKATETRRWLLKEYIDRTMRTNGWGHLEAS